MIGKKPPNSVEIEEENQGRKDLVVVQSSRINLRGQWCVKLFHSESTSRPMVRRVIPFGIHIAASSMQNYSSNRNLPLRPRQAFTQTGRQPHRSLTTQVIDNWQSFTQIVIVLIRARHKQPGLGEQRSWRCHSLNELNYWESCPWRSNSNSSCVTFFIASLQHSHISCSVLVHPLFLSGLAPAVI